MASSPLRRVAARSSEHPDENFSQKVNRKMYRAGVAAIPSQLAVRTGWRWSRTSASKRRRPARCRRSQGMEDSVLVITDEIDENLFLSRNLHQVLVRK